MRSIKKLSILAASTLALGLGTAANAAVFVQTETANDGLVTTDSGTITTDSGVEFVNNDLNLAGSFIADNNMASVLVGEGVTQIALDFDVDQALPNGRRARGIQNFSLTVMGDMGAMFSLSGITAADGTLIIPSMNTFAVTAGETLMFQFFGEAFATNTNFTPGYSVGAFAVDAVPVPAAGLLFATAAIGGGIARRKRKVA